MAHQSSVVTLTSDEHLRAAIDVHAAVHGDPAPVWEEFLFRHPVWAAEGAHRAILDGDQIVALTSLAMWRHRFGNTMLPTAEIGLVGTLPDYRRRGLSRRLMESCIETMRTERIPLSFLIGIPGFYEQWDYHYAAPDHVNAFLSIQHDALARCAASGATVREADPERDLTAICSLIASEYVRTPCSPQIDETLARYFIEQADLHGVSWRVVEDDEGEVSGVVRMKRWADGIGPQASGAVTLVAARNDDARAAVASELLAHFQRSKEPELSLAIAPHGPFADWLFHRGARRGSDHSIYPGGYAAMYRINDLVPVLEAFRPNWDTSQLAARFDGTSATLSVGRDASQVATIDVSSDGIDILPGSGGVTIDAPPAVTVPWITGWRSASDWLDATPFPPLPGPAFEPGSPQNLPAGVSDLLRELFPRRHPYIGDTIQGA